jgi:DNA-binding IclR family transcriptional regulator
MRQASDTNAAQKVCRLLSVLSTPQPLRLTDIVAASGIKATTLRLLETLIGEGFVRAILASKRYLLGDAALVLGIAMQGRDHIRSGPGRPGAPGRAVGRHLLLSTRHGLESVCIDREFGSFRSAPTTSSSAAAVRSAPAPAACRCWWLPRRRDPRRARSARPVFKKATRASLARPSRPRSAWRAGAATR